mmetsp:Transcript_36907/g.47698  ORF Transcript_36907/g.47698 Transcript_36907/m.47698 type:complete len:172 (+) Transcript_36907:744-1259(+)
MFNSRCVFVNVYVFRNGANLSSEYGMHTPLILATRHSHRDLVIMLLAAGVDIDGVDGSGHTALHIAAEEGLVSMMELLLDKGAAVDCLNGMGSLLGLSQPHNIERYMSCHVLSSTWRHSSPSRDPCFEAGIYPGVDGIWSVCDSTRSPWSKPFRDGACSARDEEQCHHEGC